MQFSDLFQKFTRTEPVKAIQRGPNLIPDHLSRARGAAREFLSILKTEMIDRDGSLHAGTMLCAAAWLTGTSLYRSFHFREDSPSGTIVKSNEVNTTWEGLMYMLEQYSFHRAGIPIGRLIRGAMALPELHRPRVEMLYIQRELQERYNAVMKKHGFGYLDGARVGIVLCSILIEQYHAGGILDSEPAVGLVAEKVLEAAKTIPPPLKN